ncbi:GPP34 family phosphoprotein [Micromonospora sp. BRA006-A]|nr:GPP34 family phosphoprotein [Micromonospora sp. BRA006-A]
MLLFQPASGTVAGENTLFYVLGGAVLADLTLGDHLTTAPRTRISVVGSPPKDGLLRPAWDYLAEKPRGVQTVLAAIGPTLREPVLQRLIARGDIDRQPHEVLGLFRSTACGKDGPNAGRGSSPTSGRRSSTVCSRRPGSPRSRPALGERNPPWFHREIPGPRR